jgi:hypothetical protein
MRFANSPCFWVVVFLLLPSTASSQAISATLMHDRAAAAVERPLPGLADVLGAEPTLRASPLFERGPFFWTDKLMLLYQLIRSPHETYPPSHIHG